MFAATSLDSTRTCKDTRKWPVPCFSLQAMSKASGNDGAPPADIRGIPPIGSSIAARRRALKAMLLPPRSCSRFRPSPRPRQSTCQYELEQAKLASPPAPISDTPMSIPSWFRLVVTEQVYGSGSDAKTLYKYDNGSTIRYYEPPDTRHWWRSADRRHADRDAGLRARRHQHESFEPDFKGTGFNSTMSCMASMPDRRRAVEWCAPALASPGFPLRGGGPAPIG
jgi:hypothetical protein